jgi:hypothetical protein
LGRIVLKPLPIIACSLALAMHITASVDGQVFVAESGSATIGEYTTTGAVVNSSLIQGIVAPTSIVVSGSDLFVSYDSIRVGEYTTSGATVNADLFNEIYPITSMAVSGSDIFVTEVTVGKIGEYTTSGTLVTTSLVSGLTLPSSLAISGSDLFVANVGAGLTALGEYTTSGATVNASLITGLDDPTDVGISGDNILITSFGILFAYSDTSGVWTGSVLDVRPTDFAIAGSNIFSIDGDDIGEYTTSGTVVNADLVSGLSDPTAIAVAVPEPTKCLAFAIAIIAFYMSKRPARSRTGRREFI